MKFPSYFCIFSTDIPPLEEVACPQQDNGHDCGIFTVIFAEYIMNKLTRESSLEIQSALSFADIYDWPNFSSARNFRSILKNEILELAAA